MSIPVLDLNPIHAPLQAEIDAAMQRVARSATFIQGPDVAAFEREMVAFLGGRDLHAVGCANGTDALVLALLALGVGAGDEVIIPAFTFIATGTSVLHTGARPVLADIDPATFNLSIDDALARLTPRTRAVMPVHLFGRPFDVHRLRAALDDRGRDDVMIVEDAAQGLGGLLRGEPVCTLTEAGCTSFFPSKNLGGFGDGGMVYTRSAETAARLRMLCSHGSKVKYFNEILGFNSRLDTLQAAVLRVKLPHLRSWCDERRRHAAGYAELFGAAKLGDAVRLPAGDDATAGIHHTYNQYTLRVADRDGLQAHLKQRGIGTMIYYPRTLAEQPVFASLGVAPAEVPHSTAACAEVLSIPVFPGMTPEQRAEVAAAIASFYHGSTAS